MDFLALTLLALRIADLAAVASMGVVAYWLRNGIGAVPQQEIMGLAFAVLLCLVIFNMGRVYQPGIASNARSAGIRIAGYWLLVFLLLLAAAFMLKVSDHFSRIWAGIWLILTTAGLVAVRAVGACLLARARSRGLLATRVGIIGADEIGLRLHRYLKKYDETVDIVGVFDDRMERLRDAAEREGVRILGTAADVVPWARENRIDRIVIALPWTGEKRLRNLIASLQILDVDVQICPEGLGFVLDGFPILRHSIADSLGGLPMFTVLKRPLDGWNWLTKRIEDVILLLLFAPIAVPLCLLIALAIKLDSPGPVLFRQKRAGFTGRTFWVMKFRTMRDVDGEPDGATTAASRSDPRVTRVGYILRRTSLDELPQFINVLRGEMSVVGPRPHAISHDKQFAQVIEQYYTRQRVRPGITGWAQVNGFRGGIEDAEDLRGRVDYDLWYIENWSILLDMWILAMTPFVGLINRNAY